MRRLFALVVSACLGLGAPLPAGGALPNPAAFDLKSHPLPRAYADLLSKNKYDLRADGTVWAPQAKTAVAQAEMPFLLQRLESGQRLKALLQLDMLLSNSDGEKYLTPVERENLRKIVRDSWPFFTLGTRKDFRHFFSVQELEELNRDPAPTDSATSLAMNDPEPLDYSNAEAPPPLKPVPMPRLLPAPLPPQPVIGDGFVAEPAKTPPAVAPAVYYVAQLPPAPVLPPTPMPQPALAAPPPPPAAALAPVATPPPLPAVTSAMAAMPDVGVMKPWTPPQSPAPPPAMPPGITLAHEAAAPAAPPPAPPAAPAAAPYIPAPVEAAVASAAGPPSRVVAQPAPPPAPPAAVQAPMPPTQPVAEAGLPPAHPVSREEFERFLSDAPYGRDAKALLRMISDKALEPARSRALGAVLGSLPQIVFDTTRAGLDSHAALLAIETPGLRAYTIALSPGPILFEKKRLFGKNPLVMLSDSAKIYASLHVPMPAVEALNRDAAAVSQENGPWGATRVFSDGSRRSAYTAPQQAGYLLRKLLRLDAKRGGWDASSYAAEAYARSAQWMFYARLMLDLKDDSFLDPETRANFRQWRDHPVEYRDQLVHTLSAGRVQTLDQRRGNAEAQAAFNRAAAADCLPAYKADMQARLDADREALKKDAQALARAGLLEDSALESAQKAIDLDFAAVKLPQPTPEQCSARYLSEAGALRAAAALFAEMSQSERVFRSETSAHDPSH